MRSLWTTFGAAIPMAVLILSACSEAAPTDTDSPVMTEARFAELQAQAVRIAERVELAGRVTAEDRSQIDAIRRELDTCVDVTVERRRGPVPTETASAAIVPGVGGGCTPCPFIVRSGNCIGILRSSGPCRPGAGLERCFYNWYCYGSIA